MAVAAPDPYWRSGSFRAQSDINVTPLVDVMLVLLIIFMVTAPLLAAGVKVNLPQANAAQPLDPKEPIVIVIGKDGKVALGGDVVDPADLVALVKAKMSDDPSRIVRLRGDKDALFGQIVGVMDDLASNGIVHIAIVTEKNSKPRPALEAAK